MKVLVATDGSDVALDAARKGSALLGDAAEITVLAVITAAPGEDAGGIEGSVETPQEIQTEIENETRRAEEEIDAVLEILSPAQRAAAKGRIEAGDPGPMIVWVAEDERSDVVVVGSHGKGALKRVFLGSVSEHVMRHSPCPVLVVRAPAD